MVIQPLTVPYIEQTSELLATRWGHAWGHWGSDGAKRCGRVWPQTPSQAGLRVGAHMGTMEDQPQNLAVNAMLETRAERCR